MSTTMNLAHGLLARAILLSELGRTHEAYQILKSLIGLQEIPGDVAQEAQFRLAEIELLRRQYHRARRHLAAALAYSPNNARYHYMMAGILDRDEDADPRRAYEHYRRSLELQPDQADCLGDFGLLALSLEKPEEGLRALRQAAELDPNDPETVGKLVEGLCELEEENEARLVLWAALFRNPKHAGFRKLWSDFQFQQLHRAQEAARQSFSAEHNREVLLPFVRLAPNTLSTPPDKKRHRADQASTPRPPRSTGPTRLPGKRRA